MGGEIVTEIKGIVSFLDEVLLVRDELAQASRVSSGRRWAASQIGMCRARQHLKAASVPSTQPFTALSRRRMTSGSVIEDFVLGVWRDAGALVGEQVDVGDDLLQVSGYVDAVLDFSNDNIVGPYADAHNELCQVMEGKRVGVEIKSVNSKSFWYAKKNKTDVAGDHQILQAATYALLAPADLADEWLILSVSRDDLSMALTWVEEHHMEKAKAIIETLNNEWTSGLGASCTCGDDWQLQYCPYLGLTSSGTIERGWCCGKVLAGSHPKIEWPEGAK